MCLGDERLHKKTFLPLCTVYEMCLEVLKTLSVLVFEAVEPQVESCVCGQTIDNPQTRSLGQRILKTPALNQSSSSHPSLHQDINNQCGLWRDVGTSGKDVCGRNKFHSPSFNQTEEIFLRKDEESVSSLWDNRTSVSQWSHQLGEWIEATTTEEMETPCRHEDVTRILRSSARSLTPFLSLLFCIQGFPYVQHCLPQINWLRASRF